MWTARGEGNVLPWCGYEQVKPPHRITRSAPFQLVARVGVVTYGIVHLLVAWLAVHVAIGDGGDAGQADKAGALGSIAATGGAWLLWLIAIGLGASALWQLCEAMFGAGKRTRLRAMNLGEALLFGCLSFSAGKPAAGAAAASTDAAQLGLVGQLLGQPWGRPVVVAIGLAIVVAALFVARHGLARRFVEEHDYRAADPAMRDTVVRLGQVDYAALGAVYGIAGALVVVAAVRSDPSKATGLDVALKTLAGRPFGPILLLVIAAGLTAFAVFTFLDAPLPPRLADQSASSDSAALIAANSSSGAFATRRWRL